MTKRSFDSENVTVLQPRKRNTPSDKISHLKNQADRARRLAAVCGSASVAELWEMHAVLCDQKAELRQRRRNSKALRLCGTKSAEPFRHREQAAFLGLFPATPTRKGTV